MLKIRLQRIGRVHEPSFRLVLTDSKNSTKSGRFKEVLGSYDPRKSTDSLHGERIKYWLSMGANPTDTVHNLLVKHRIINAKKVNVSAKSKKAPVIKEEVKKEEKTAPVESPTEEVEEVAFAEGSSAPKEDVIIEEVPEPASVQDSGVAKEKTV